MEDQIDNKIMLARYLEEQAKRHFTGEALQNALFQISDKILSTPLEQNSLKKEDFHDNLNQRENLT